MGLARAYKVSKELSMGFYVARAQCTRFYRDLRGLFCMGGVQGIGLRVLRS